MRRAPFRTRERDIGIFGPGMIRNFIRNMGIKRAPEHMFAIMLVNSLPPLCNILSHSCIKHYFLTWRVRSLILGLLFYQSVCQMELCAWSVKIVIFDTSAKKLFYPHVESFRPSEARVESSHEDKIIFSLEYRTLFFYTTCGKLNVSKIELCVRSV